MAKITKPQLKEFNQTFDRCLDHVVEWMKDYKDAFQKTVYETELTSELNFNSLAKQAFLYRLGNFYNKHNIMEEMIREVHNLLDFRDGPDLELDK